jgi:hypothetical protein
MKREIRDKRHKLQHQWGELRGLALDSDKCNGMKLRKEEDKVYKKWQFYDGIIKAMEVVNEKKSNINSNI